MSSQLLAARCEELTAVGDVTVVAPHENQSGVGRARNSRGVRHNYPRGYSLEGIPADCVAYTLRGQDTEFDAVVAGVNDWPNAGNHVVGRSSTVGTGIEAAFLGLPGVAISAYHADDFVPHLPEKYDFSRSPSRGCERVAGRRPRLSSGGVAPVSVAGVPAPCYLCWYRAVGTAPPVDRLPVECSP